MLKSDLLPFKIFVVFLILNLLGLAASMDKAGIEQANQRPSPKANTPNPSLKGLTNVGVLHEENLERDLKSGKVKQEDVSRQRVNRLWDHKRQAEKGRNENHKDILFFKQKMRKEENRAGRRSDDIANKRYLQAKKGYESARGQRGFHQGHLEDVHIDAKVHRDEGNFSQKDFHTITKMEYPHESHELGYHSDGRSNGSSFGPTPSLTSSSSGSPHLSSHHGSPSPSSHHGSPSLSNRYRSPSPPRRLYASSSSRSRSP
ncbi:uncharacterized protein FA14DRAFT_183755 [Meira miltonrushii]|uniref:Uncharacterized protein n=1 Tax=Meira miltonrushii TaxID=1280837 RepID=A0A316VKV7_9BASI|nr:uncharacterized protein FA14DRAFT_183755 [Meira miltonrushii]PWN38196.1 hypothetical protein FA14DRAFT_183755 [Meira miltonrushii]